MVSRSVQVTQSLATIPPPSRHSCGVCLPQAPQKERTLGGTAVSSGSRLKPCAERPGCIRTCPAAPMIRLPAHRQPAGAYSIGRSFQCDGNRHPA